MSEQRPEETVHNLETFFANGADLASEHMCVEDLHLIAFQFIVNHQRASSLLD
jgi:hypothetical protein